MEASATASIPARSFFAVSLSDVIRDVLRERGLEETRERMIETGRELRRASGEMPVSTSSFDTPRVVRSRCELFARLREAHGAPAAEWLVDYPRSHVPDRGACAVCMHRADAHTVSFSRIRVDPQGIEFRYWPTAPCRMGEPTVVRLPARPLA